MGPPKKENPEGTWDEVKSFVQKVWSDLSDRDLDGVKDTFEDLVDRIQEKTGETRDRIKKRLEKYVERIGYKFRNKDN